MGRHGCALCLRPAVTLPARAMLYATEGAHLWLYCCYLARGGVTDGKDGSSGEF